MRRQQRRRRYAFAGLWATLALVAVLVVVLVVVQRIGSKNDTRDVDATAPRAVVADLASVPSAVFDRVGASGIGSSVAGLRPVSGSPDLTDGEPTLIYVGGEFCPYCAAQRWVLATALDRFGRFTGLQTTRSAADDGDFATLTFVDAHYTSHYVAFDGKEIYDRARRRLQSLSAAAQASYASFGSVGAVPYFSVNNAFIGSYQYDPEALGSTPASAIAAQIRAGRTALAHDVLAAANVLTAAICRQTGEQPTSICTSAGVVAAGKAGLSG